ncbi:MAG: oxidoreductase domain protein [Microgenomates group bacterium GW2011_GWC1_43_11]|uniref:Oxidoreductase domain protein n=2 Tax=Candidatus Gottesmaniibacteriota TaxID=1752720 RepID=A0A0G1KXG8_9BACT|nr:MAG: oxidoreductase domain protein [Microgenomates group bacterium GW2011_GWC1_43_11]KKT37609.1 MAG: oxidoreductase domain protein [Candidatus Gottesmanbacteria bacterium GW2011_GWB1_44_11c]KKT61022.1 MAG: oxidoreductase domain protein [Candidatus Gottesmanbacteria bacterium GW2011_GWA1_44_24b]
MNLFPQKVITIGMIGMGNISNIHVDAFRMRKDVHIKAISDSNQSLLLRKSGELDIAETYPDYRFMLNDPCIDVIDVMTPHSLHKQCVCDALNAGKTVICEKPLATTLRDIDKIIRVSESKKKYVYIKQYLRYSTAYQKALELLEDNKIGTPYFIQCLFTGNSVKDYLSPLTWRGSTSQAGGGVFIDVGVHMLDLLQLYFKFPSALYMQSRRITASLPEKGEDFASAIIEFPNNLTVSISCTHNDIGYKFRWEVRIYGRNGVITILDNGKQEKQLHVIKENKIVYEFTEIDWWRQSNIRALHDIINRILSHKSPPVSYLHARSVIQTIRESYRSAKTGKRLFLNKTAQV